MQGPKMRSRQDKSTLTQETYELFTSHIIKLIQTESKCSPYIAKVKIDRNKYVPCVTFHATSERITVELGLCEGIKELPPAIVDYIRKSAQSVFDQFNIKCSVKL